MIIRSLCCSIEDPCLLEAVLAHQWDWHISLCMLFGCHVVMYVTGSLGFKLAFHFSVLFDGLSFKRERYEWANWVRLSAENGKRAEPEAVPAFREYSLESLKAATNGFSSEYIVSESGEKAPNFVYKGRLDQNHMIAVKRFPKAAWPDSKGFTVICYSS